MSVLAILHLPIIFINTLGTNHKISLSVSAAMTTFGNLGSSALVGSVAIPGCDETEFQFEHCEIGTLENEEHILCTSALHICLLIMITHDVALVT